MLELLDKAYTPSMFICIIGVFALIVTIAWNVLALGYSLDDMLVYLFLVKWRLALIIIVVSISIIGIGGSAAISRSLRNEIIKLSSGYDSLTCKVYINNKQQYYPNIILDEINLIHSPVYNHSSPYEYIDLKIQTKTGSLTFKCGRDNIDSSMYWVYCDKYNYSKQNSIGQFNSSELAQYFSK